MRLAWFNKEVGQILVFLFSLLIRLPDLGRDLFNPDSFLWKTRSYQFLGSIATFDFAATAPVSHPGVTLMGIGAVATKLFNLYHQIFRGGLPPDGAETILNLHFAHKLVLATVISFLLAVAFYLLKKLIDKRTAFLVVLLLCLEPFFLALSRTFHLDILLTLFMFLAVLSFLVFLKETKGFKYLVLSSLFTALALLTKSTALFLLPFLGLLLILDFRNSSSGADPGSKYPRSGICWLFPKFLVLCSLFFVLFWPSMWVAPLKTTALYLSGIVGEGFGGHTQVVFGTPTDNPGPLFYLLCLGIRLSPWLLLLSLGGVFLPPHSSNHARKCGWTCVSTGVLFTFLYLIFLVIPTKKLERYVLPIYPWLAVLGGVFLNRVNRVNPFKGVNPIWTSVLATVAILFLTAISLAPLHPNYLAYYSPLVGGLSKGPFIIEPSWVVGSRKVGEYMNSLPGAGEFKFSIPNWDQYQPFSKSKVYGVAEFFEGLSDYLVMPVWGDLSRYEDHSTLENIQVIKIGNVPVYNVFKVIGTN